jgi:predicted negative regulator of RcsB-dependent stress response
MNFLKKLFTRNPEDCLVKGDRLMASGSFYEARGAYEEGLESCRGKQEYAPLIQQLTTRVTETNRSLAARNIEEADHAIRQGSLNKAVEHLELAKTLTLDAGIREKAEHILAGLVENTNDKDVLASPSSCSSCSHTAPDSVVALDETVIDLDPLEHYDLLIRQLPEEMYERYSGLGEEFAYMYITASQDQNTEALKLLDKWFSGSHRDIYCYEKSKILHRLGKISESETYMLESIGDNAHNPLPHLGLALLYIDENRLDDAARQIDSMISAEIFTGQALMMRGEVFELAGDLEGAIRQYGMLLETPLARAAAERLHEVLIASDRKPEAAHIFKRYLGKCQH